MSIQQIVCSHENVVTPKQTLFRTQTQKRKIYIYNRVPVIYRTIVSE